MSVPRTIKQLSYELDMLATQLREFPQGGGVPNPWRFDDWLTEYRERYKRLADQPRAADSARENA